MRYLLGSVLSPRTFSRRERLRALSAVEFGDVRFFADEFRSSADVECLFFGNVDRGRAQEMADLVIGITLSFLEG